MKLRFFIIPILAMLVLLFHAGCKQQETGNAPVPAAVAPKVMTDAFQGASSALQQGASAIAQATRRHDPEAVVALQQLSQQAELTPAQRLAIGRCLPAALSSAREAAATGNRRAEQILQQYNASK